jgi:exopolysaccharide production protein ExoQ
MTAAAIGQPKAATPWGSPFSAFTETGEHKAPLWDYAAVILWIAITTFIVLPGLTPIRYALAAYFVAGLALHWRTLLPMAAKNVVFFFVPILAVISSLWAPSAPEAVRQGLLLAMTVIVAIFIAGRLNAKQIIRAYFYVELVAGLASLLFLNNQYGAASGIFPQKNVLAAHMFFLYVSGLAIVLDAEEKPLLRLAAAAALPIGLVLIVLSQSATQIGFSVVMTAAFLGQHFLWSPAAKIPHARTLIVVVGGAVAMVAGIVLFGIMEVDAGDALLGALGKDSSLTGRTYLWEQARAIMADKPWTGVGSNGFWLAWRGEANSITHYFHFKTFTPFNFHNSYFELGVALGYPGMYAGILMCCWALLNTLRRWFLNQSLVNFFFLAMAGMIVVRSNTEVDLATEFGATLVMLMVATMRPAKQARAPMPVAEPDPAAAPPPATRPPPLRYGYANR